MLFFTADQHFFHTNIIRSTNRPWLPTDQNDKLIEHWNNVVGEDDIVWQLGDFSFGTYENTVEIIKMLNGNIFFVIPHDHHDKRWLKKWLKVGMPLATKTGQATYKGQFHVLRLKVLCRDGYSMKISLLHYPLASWEASYHGAIHLHGHSHGKMPWADNRMDVGVDCNHYEPVAIGHIVYEMQLLKKGWEWHG